MVAKIEHQAQIVQQLDQLGLVWAYLAVGGGARGCLWNRVEEVIKAIIGPQAGRRVR